MPPSARAALKPALLDAAGHRHAHVAGSSVERTDASRGVIHGPRILRGVSKAVDLPFPFSRLARAACGLRPLAGVSATALDRRDFGVTAFSDSIADQLLVRRELGAIRDAGAAPASQSTSQETP